MDSNLSTEEIGSVDLPEEVVALIGEKRPLEDGDLGFPATKKAKNGGGLVVNVKKAAEIVLVLAAMGKMRGGRSPSAAEKQMMAEAREKLAKVCQEFAPKDVFPRDAFGAVIEDIGLNQLKEQKLGIRPPKMSIAEKFLFTKHKRLQTNSGAAADVALHATTRTPQSNRPSHPTIPSVGFQPAAPLSHGSAGNSTSLPYQLPASEVRTPLVSSGLPSSLLGRDPSTLAVPRADRPHFRPEPRLNGSSYTFPIKVNPSGDQAVQKSPTFVQQFQSSLSGKTGPDNKVLSHPSVQAEVTVMRTTSRLTSQASTSKPLTPQATSGRLVTMHQPMRAMDIVQGSSLSNPHIEIGRIVQKLLQMQVPDHATWTPPSRDYMSKSLTCQVCKVTLNEVENVLVCDVCEKGYHLKCLESHNQKGVPKGEWHCFKCLSLSNGKPLPPKYGRVTRNMNAPKVHPNSAAVQPSLVKKVEKLGEKEIQQKIIANGISDIQITSGSVGNNYSSLEIDSRTPNGRETQGNNILSSRENIDVKRPENIPDDAIRSSGSACASVSAGLSVERSYEEKLVSERKGHCPAKLYETGSKMLDHLEATGNLLNNGQVRFPDRQCHDNNLTVEVSEKSHSSKILDDNPNGLFKQEEQGALHSELADVSSTGILVGEHARSPSDVSDNVDWIGDVLQVVEENIYYQSCCVDGVVYKVHDHALLYSSNGKLMPSKLQAMWEDRKSRLKWVIANRCYFHDDLPEAVGRPCSPESNEVCDSNHGITVMAGLIRGPCEVLPPGKYIEESQRRSRLGSRENDGLRPLFLCKWFFDELKGVFRDVSS